MQPRTHRFESAFASVSALPGWLTEAQARCLFDAARQVPEGGTAVEIGSHHGRSTIVLASALAPDARLVAVDPFPEDWKYGAAGTEAALRQNLVAAGLAAVVDLRVATSRDVRSSWREDRIHLVYIDGKHDFWSCRDDLRWSEHVVPGGSVFVHDAFSSFGVTTALLRELATSRSLRYVDRVGSLGRLEVGAPTARDRLRMIRELPWWARNLVVKALLRLRLGPLAGILGHRGAADPF